MCFSLWSTTHSISRCSVQSEFVYKNLESLTCIIMAGLLIAIAASRIMADQNETCLSSYLHVEKNCISVLSYTCLSTIMLMQCSRLVCAMHFKSITNLRWSKHSSTWADHFSTTFFNTATSHEAIQSIGAIFHDIVRLIWLAFDVKCCSFCCYGNGNTFRIDGVMQIWHHHHRYR